MDKKSTPPTITHKNCSWDIEFLNKGPHFAKFVCVNHNRVFVQWISEQVYKQAQAEIKLKELRKEVKNGL